MGYESADDWAVLFASSIIVLNTYRILRPAINEVMDAVPSAEVDDSIRRVAQRVEGVIAVEKCFVRKMGFSYYVDLHVTAMADSLCDEVMTLHGRLIGRSVLQTRLLLKS